MENGETEESTHKRSHTYKATCMHILKHVTDFYF